MRNIAKFSLILSFCYFHQSFTVRIINKTNIVLRIGYEDNNQSQPPYEDNQWQVTQENNSNFINNNTDSLQEITLNKIINKIPAQDLLKQVLAGKLNNTDAREILKKKLLQTYKLKLINLFELDKNSTVLQGHRLMVTSGVFSPCGRFALTGYFDGTARLWDLSDLNNIKSIVLQGHRGSVNSVAFSPCGRFALTRSFDNTARLWDLSDLNNIKSIVLQGHTNGVTAVAFSPCSRFALTGSYDETAILWDLSDLNNIKSISLQGHNDSVTSVAFSPCGRFALTGSDDETAKLWDLSDLNNIKSIVLQGHTNWIRSVVFSPCGRFALTGSADRTVRLWILEPTLTLEQLLLIAVLFEYKTKELDCQNILQNINYNNIFQLFSDQQKNQIRKYFNIQTSLFSNCIVS